MGKIAYKLGMRTFRLFYNQSVNLAPDPISLELQKKLNVKLSQTTTVRTTFRANVWDPFRRFESTLNSLHNKTPSSTSQYSTFCIVYVCCCYLKSESCLYKI